MPPDVRACACACACTCACAYAYAYSGAEGTKSTAYVHPAQPARGGAYSEAKCLRCAYIRTSAASAFAMTMSTGVKSVGHRVSVGGGSVSGSG